MFLLKTENKIFIKKCIASLLVSCFILPIVPAGRVMGEETDVMQTEYKGVIYSYQGLGVLVADRNSVEVTGAIVPEGTTTLEIPETLGGKTVISIDLYKGVKSQSGEDKIRIKKLVLSKNIRPMATAEKTRNKYIKSFGTLMNLESIEVASDSKYLEAKDGVLYNKGMSSVLEYPVCKRAAEYKMPSSVTWSTGISNKYLKKIVFSSNKKYTEASAGGEKLESIYLPDNITKVAGFYRCTNLKKIRWSQNLKIIDAFEYCESLKKIKLPDKVREIGQNAFRRCSGLKEVVLPNGLRKIGGDAFGSCISLKKVTIPESVSYVGSGAFARTSEKLKVKKASYLMSRNNPSIKGKVPDYYKYIAVATLTKGKKKKYYNFQRILKLKPLDKELNIRIGQTKKVSVNAGISRAKLFDLNQEIDLPGDLPRETFVNRGWKLKTDILSFASSNPKVVMVTSKGKIKALKKVKQR